MHICSVCGCEVCVSACVCYVKEVKVCCSAKKTGKQRERGIVPFHVKGKAELWYRLKDLLRNQNRETHIHTFLEKYTSQGKQITVYFNIKISWASTKWLLSTG